MREGLPVAGPLPKWWDTLDPTGCRGEAGGAEWGSQRNESTGRGFETGIQVPEQRLMVEAVGGAGSSGAEAGAAG